MKPHRVLFTRVSVYAEEGAAYLRRRRAARRPFARVYDADGSAADLAGEGLAGEALFAAAGLLIEAARAERAAAGGERGG